MVCPLTTGLRISASSAPTVPQRSRLTVVARTALTFELRPCALCGRMFVPPRANQRYCSVKCGSRHDNRDRRPKPATRKVSRPSYEQLMADVESMSMVAVGRKYGVSDKAVRKWIRWYEYQRER